MLNRTPEKLRENNAHYEQSEQGREQAPPHAQHCAFILLLEVALDELLKHELMSFELFYHFILCFIAILVLL